MSATLAMTGGKSGVAEERKGWDKSCAAGVDSGRRRASSSNSFLSPVPGPAFSLVSIVSGICLAGPKFDQMATGLSSQVLAGL